MESRSIKRLIRPVRISLILVLVIIVVGLGYIGTIQKDYLVSLFFKPYRVDRASDTKEFFTRERAPLCSVGNLYFFGTIDCTPQNRYTGESMMPFKVYALYYTILGDEIIFAMNNSDINAIDPHILKGDKYRARVIDKDAVPLSEEFESGLKKLAIESDFDISSYNISYKALEVTNKDLLYSMREFAVICIVIFIVSLYQLIKTIATHINIKCFSGIRRLNQYGGYKIVFNQIEEETWIFQLHREYLTQQWWIDNRKKRVVRLDEIVWCYNKGFYLPIRNINISNIYLKNGKRYRVFWINDNNAFNFINKIRELNPQCIYGYSKEYMVKWKNSRGNMI